MSKNSKLKICMVMFYDENIKEYSEISCKINKFYCDKHSIDLVVSNETSITNKVLSSNTISSNYWERYFLILKYIQDYDYVIYMDTDAFFYFNSRSIIDELLTNENHDKSHFIFSQDYVPHDLNAGFFIVKKNEYSIDFLKEMLKKEVNDRYHAINEILKISYAYDQTTLSGLYRDNFMDIQNKSARFDYGFLQYFFTEDTIQYYDKNEWTYPPQPFVCHLAGTTKETRLKILSTYYNKITNGEIHDA